MYAPDGLKSGPASNCGSGFVEDRKHRFTPDHRRRLLRRIRQAWRETELLRNGKRVRHDSVFEDFAVTNGVDVDRHPLDAIARAGTSEELPAMRTTEAIDEYDLVAFRDNVEHLGSRVGDRLVERLVELSPSTGTDLGSFRREG